MIFFLVCGSEKFPVTSLTDLSLSIPQQKWCSSKLLWGEGTPTNNFLYVFFSRANHPSNHPSSVRFMVNSHSNGSCWFQFSCYWLVLWRELFQGAVSGSGREAFEVMLSYTEAAPSHNSGTFVCLVWWFFYRVYHAKSPWKKTHTFFLHICYHMFHVLCCPSTNFFCKQIQGATCVFFYVPLWGHLLVTALLDDGRGGISMWGVIWPWGDIHWIYIPPAPPGCWLATTRMIPNF